MEGDEISMKFLLINQFTDQAFRKTDTILIHTNITRVEENELLKDDCMFYFSLLI